MLSLKGYTILNQIHENNNTRIFHALKEDESPVILKVSDASVPNLVARLKHEFTLLESLNIEQVSKVLELTDNSGHKVLVIKDYGGVSLNRLKEFLSSSSLMKLIEIMAQIAKILGDIHKENIIHKDIKSANILYSQESGSVEIIDFGIASKIDVKIQHLGNPEHLEGSLPYISPEQTGRMNRVIDYRSDLYSLGITFYEMIAGNPPFDSVDPMELVYSHIAKTPPPISIGQTPFSQNQLEKEVLQVLTKIIDKLLNKNAEDRYQSAYGLYQDLLQLIEILNSKKEDFISRGFILGKKDFSGKLNIPQKLYGREKELQILMDTFGRLERTGNCELLLISGYSGVGKSALVNEIHKPITEKRGNFISGKYDQFQKNIPYSAFTQAFEELCNNILTQNEEVVEEWKNKILTAVGNNAGVLIDVIPELELVLGKQPPVVEVGGQEALNRFNMVFQTFMKAISSSEHSLVIFIDDLQWADSASLNLLRLIMTDSEITNLLFIGAYRDNEVDPTHPFITTLDEIKKKTGLITKVELSELKREAVLNLVIDTLKQNSNHTVILSDLIFAKTKGNAFFIIELLKNLYSEKLLQYNFEHNEWNWNIHQIRDFSITENVVDLLTQKIRGLPGFAQEILKKASCISAVFDLKTLSIVNADTPTETFSQLWPSIEEGIVIPLDENYRLVSEDNDNLSDFNSRFKFAHDRIQQAAYHLIDDDQKKAIHLTIGQLLLKEIREENMFSVIDHLNFSKELIQDATEKKQLVEYNIKCATKARENTAYISAQKYLNHGLEIIQNEKWRGEYYSASYELFMLRSEILTYLTKFDEANLDTDEIIQNADNNYHKANAFLLKIEQRVILGDYKGAVNLVNDALKLFDWDISALLADPKQLEAQIGIQLQDSYKKLMELKIENIINLPDVQDENSRYIIKLFVSIIDATYISDPYLALYIFCRMMNFILDVGLSKESSFCILLYLAPVVFLIKDYDTGYALGKIAIQVNERFNNKAFESKLIFSRAVVVNHFKEPLAAVIADYNKAFSLGMERGEYNYSCYCRTMLPKTMLAGGYSIPEVLEESNKSISFLGKVNSPLYHVDYLYKNFLLNLSEKKEDNTSFSDANIDENFLVGEWQKASFGHALAYYLNIKTQILFMFEFYEEAFTFMNSNYAWSQSIVNFYEQTLTGFYFALCYFRINREVENLATPIPDILQSYKTWSENSPDNFIHKYYLLMAEEARVKKENTDTVISLYNSAIQYAKEYKFLNIEALANELAGKFFIEKGFSKIASSYLVEANRLYSAWGGHAKSKQLAEKYSSYLEQTGRQEDHREKTKAVTTHITATSYGANQDNLSLDLYSVLKSAEALSGEIELSSLLKKLISIVMENAGARKVILIRKEDKKMKIDAIGILEKETEVLTSISPDNYEEIPKTVINFTMRTQKPLILNDAAQDEKYSQDPYIQKNGVKSILCQPVLNKGELVAILYLENNVSDGVFTRQRVSILNMLSSQIAISIENAVSYTNLEEKVKNRTQELRAVLEEVNSLKEQQDGDYFLTSLLLDPLYQNKVKSKNFQVEFYLNQKKKFSFKNKTHEIGGDINIAHSVLLNDKPYIILFNGDAMGKSSQGAGGALVLGTAFNVIVERLKDFSHKINFNPVKWLTRTTIELSKTFQAFDGLMSMSAVLGIIDETENYFYFVNTEHPFVVLYRDEIAHFIEKKNLHQKLGFETFNTSKVAIHKFRLLPGDILISGSDGRDDLELESAQEGRKINIDETIFLRNVEKGKGNLKEIAKHVMDFGHLIDDFSMLRIEYRTNT